MMTLKGPAHAKLNLTLDVTGQRPDGYHNLQMVMQEISLGDEVTLTLGTGQDWEMACTDGGLPTDNTNLAMKAARLFFDATGIDCGGLSVFLEKHTPSQAGMGGGSADGAAVLRLLQAHYENPLTEEQLFHLAEDTGADVPFTLLGGTALAEEKGQALTPLPAMPDCEIVLCKPDFSISTPALFRAIDSAVIAARPDTAGMLEALNRGDLSAVAARLYNVFTPLVQASHPEIGEIRDTMMSFGALGTEMTGSGPTVFGIFGDKNRARDCKKALKARYHDTYLTKPV